MAPPSTASAGARKLGDCAERCCLSRSFNVHHWFSRSSHSVGGAECDERQLEVSGRPWRDRERRGRRRRRDSASGHAFVRTTRTTSREAAHLSNPFTTPTARPLDAVLRTRRDLAEPPPPGPSRATRRVPVQPAPIPLHPAPPHAIPSHPEPSRAIPEPSRAISSHPEPSRRATAEPVRRSVQSVW